MGRSKTDWSKLLRYELWYRRIREQFPRGRNGAFFSDHELDNMFARNGERSSADPIRTFSLIKNGCPDLTASGPRGVDVVALVDARAPGTAEVFMSGLWALLKTPPGPTRVTQLLDEFIARHGLVRLRQWNLPQSLSAPETFNERRVRNAAMSITLRALRVPGTLAEIKQWLHESSATHTFEEYGIRSPAVELSLRSLRTRLRCLEFLALIYREAAFGSNSPAMELALSHFDEQLEHFLYENNIEQTYHHHILNRIQALTLPEDKIQACATAEICSALYILPEGDLEHASENQRIDIEDESQPDQPAAPASPA